MAIHTLHGLLSSKPAGATGLSVCPRTNPVNRRSRSITVDRGEYIEWGHREVVVLCCETVSGALGCPEIATDSVPRINSSSSPLASVLHLSELSDRHCAEREEL
jgi:hypothetical protein